MVLVHGSAVDSGTWQEVVPELATDYRVITYDRRGYGQSTHKPVRDHRIHAADLVAVLEHFAAEPAIIVGWSSGGNVALAVAATRPDLVRNLIVVEAPFHGLRHANGTVVRTLFRLKATQARRRPVEALEVFLRFGLALRSGGNRYDTSSETDRAEMRRYPRQVLAEWDPHPFGVMHEHVRNRTLSRITAPVTWILGGESLAWMSRLQRKAARSLPGMTTLTIPGASHLVHHDQPDRFLAAVRDAVSRQVDKP